MTDKYEKDYEQVKKSVLFWSDVGVFPYNVTTLDGNLVYMSGTLKFIFDAETDLITINGLLYQNFNYSGTLEEFNKSYILWY